MIDSGEIDIFNWSEGEHKIKFYELLEILFLYRSERKMIHNKTSGLTKKLSDQIQIGEYTTIITHSMGGELLQTSIQQYGLPESVKSIYDLQSDAPVNSQPLGSEILHRLESAQLKWYNYHCFWDQSLLASVILNLRIPVGLFGSKHKYIQNVFYPLRDGPDLHTSIIKNPKLIKKICLENL
jgi:hypothetical protein